MEKLIDTKFGRLKEEIVTEICSELKGKVMKTWQEGTNRFYQDAKSIVSEYSRAPSVVSDYSRSRSASRDFKAPYHKKSFAGEPFGD
jgi:predicted transcriptional regulator